MWRPFGLKNTADVVLHGMVCGIVAGMVMGLVIGVVIWLTLPGAG